MLDLATRLQAWYASSPQRSHPIVTMQISHSAMSKTYQLWREPYPGFVTLEDGSKVAVQPLNFEVVRAGSPPNLDQQFEINVDLADGEDEFREQMARIPLNTKEYVRIVYREYLSDNLTASQALAVLQMEAIAYIPGSAKMIASSPRYNVSTTGETYNPRDIPMLRGFK